MRFNHLNVPEDWQHYWTKYPEGYTILEALISWVSQVDGMVDNQNEWNERLEKFILDFDENLQTQVETALNAWKENGLLEEIINRYAGTRISNLEDRTFLLETEKVDKGGTEQVTWGNLAQDVKDHFLSGAAPAINRDSVNTSNIVEHAVKHNLINGFTGSGFNLYKPDRHFIPDKYVATTGLIEDAAGWGYAKIPLNGEKAISVLLPFNDYRGIIGAMAFRSASDQLMSVAYVPEITGTYQGINYVTLTVPANAGYFTVTVKRGGAESNFDNSQTAIVQEGYVIADTKNITKMFNSPIYDERYDKLSEALNVSEGNLYNQQEHYMAGWLANTDGEEQFVGGTQWGMARVPVKPNRDVSVLIEGTAGYSGMIGSIIFLDEQTQPIGRVTNPPIAGSYKGQDYINLHTPNNARYVSITNYRNTEATPYDSRQNLIVLYGNVISDETISYHVNAIDISVEKPYQGIRWTAVGDSLTEINIRSTKFYHQYIADEIGITVNNMGVSGTGYKRTDANNTAFYQRILNTPTNSDVVTMFGSFNDIGAGVPLGTVTDTTADTTAGAINLTIDNLYSRLPAVPLGIIAPTPWNSSDITDDQHTHSLYVKMLSDICKRRGIPFLDLYHSSGLRPWEESYRTLMYSRDGGNGVHPDEKGHKLIYPQIREFLKTLI